MDKVVRNGEVAVLYSPQYGGGWYSWNSDFRHRKQLLFHPVLVQMVEENRHEEITEEFICELLQIPMDYSLYVGGGVHDLKIAWVPEGTPFRIDEYDGYESVVMQSQDDWLIA